MLVIPCCRKNLQVVMEVMERIRAVDREGIERCLLFFQIDKTKLGFYIWGLKLCLKKGKIVFQYNLMG